MNVSKDALFCHSSRFAVGACEGGRANGSCRTVVDLADRLPLEVDMLQAGVVRSETLDFLLTRLRAASQCLGLSRNSPSEK